MTRPPRLASLLIVAGLAGSAVAQTPSDPAPSPNAVGTPRRVDATSNTPEGGASRASQYNYHYHNFAAIQTDPTQPDYFEPAHRSVIRHNPLPYRDDQSYGFRNPGGVGRFAEYYPPGNKFENTGKDPVQVAGFDSNPSGDRKEQMAAQSLGIRRESMIQNQINTYGRPLGYGFGFGGGIGIAYPN